MRKLLVTGGAGFIGSNFVRFALAENSPVVNLDALTYAGSLENLADLPNANQHTFVHGDICNRELIEDLLEKHEIDTLVHFAAESHVDRSILGPEQFIRTNVHGTFTLLEAWKQAWIRAGKPDHWRFHHVSTDEVFGSLGPDDPPFSETTRYAPNSPYAASKAASDHLVRAYGATYGLPYTISNCSNNYGPYQFPEKLIPLVILNALEGRELPIYGDGQQIRDWLYVEDHCQAIWTILQRGAPGETYIIGGANQPSNLLVVQTLCDLLDELAPDSQFAPHAQLIRYVTDRPGHDRRYAMDITRIRQDLGWQPRETLTTGLLKTVRWFLDHQTWVESIRRQQDYQSWRARNYDQRTSASVEGG
ncbi:MAG: dTDP-glucose 4,6-dehydratase [Anaerolineae bacterium UTCFX2]|jgi:dTDP-glucose 4,6-dehydratase|nr:dTDP-glucose 4,6-dehydratase [Anaerolineae bacterium]MCZ7552294.1 dTDP-glucose 4,6-dehydratase [Anaerolineales bacterium]OQY93279.1 MAG: dTDP-glucose 4,6-dehydratase [Anaerolineae bacterium UTCFX2]